MSRVDFDPATHPGGVYRVLTSVVVPRPIAWVSSRSAEGVGNLAPHSFFTVSCADPPIVQFTSIGRKDSLANVLATGEFVVNLAPEPLLEEINATATDFPADLDEFAEVGLEREPSRLVAPPRVAGSPVAIECVLHDSHDFGGSVVVFGRVVLISIAAETIVDGHPAIERLRPLARLGRRQWSTIGAVRELGRIKYEDWKARPGA
ncbi:MAG TPA: flavin reductase family protein [Solirubrobacterales bacterium]|nr:flavin reductase family protein [Solirubrobacterales bacterium]